MFSNHLLNTTGAILSSTKDNLNSSEIRLFVYCISSIFSMASSDSFNFLLILTDSFVLFSQSSSNKYAYVTL